MRKLLAAFLRLLSPGWGCCHCCGMPWRFTEGHATNYSENSGCFPLCESCWKRLTPEERLPYYRKLLDIWINGQELPGWPKEDYERTRWPLIQKAVLEGK